ncbi:MAG: glycosyltransferase family 4 protein [Actinobacteria bacterium]|nr:glycosyltransferase family 4 protein [Actinomycetota bacterium]
MRIAFDVSPLSHRRTGIGNYIRGVLRGLMAAAGEEHEIVPFAPTSLRGKRLIEESLAGLPLDPRLAVLPFAHGWRTAWSRACRPPAERFLGSFDVLQYWDWMYPPQRGGVRATMIHDLVPLRFPEWVTGRTRRMHGAKYRNAARTCDVIFANCEFTADDVVERLGVPRERLRVAYPGVDPAFAPDGPQSELGRPYVLTVATLEPRKNLKTVLAAHELLRDELALALAGGAGWGDQPELTGEGVIPLGYVSDDELAGLYRGAAAFVFPSRFEGFGIPVIEAMASGVPTVVSSHPSLDEACGDAAVRVDPESPAAVAEGVREALADREELVRRGLEHARRFRWEATGRVFLESYATALRSLL